LRKNVLVDKDQRHRSN